MLISKTMAIFGTEGQFIIGKKHCDFLGVPVELPCLAFGGGNSLNYT